MKPELKSGPNLNEQQKPFASVLDIEILLNTFYLT